MPPNQRERASARLNETAASKVRAERRQTIPAAPAEPGTDDLAFENEAYRYAAAWLGNHAADAATAKPFILVLSRSIAQDEEILRQGYSTLCEYDAFRSQQVVDVQGCIVVTTMNFERALVVPIETIAQTQDLFSSIRSLGFGGRCMGVLEPSQANLILLRRGLDGVSRPQKVTPGGSVALTLDDLENAVAKLHNEFTRTPTSVLEAWSNAGKGITGEKLEIRISKQFAYQLDVLGQRGSVLAEVGTHSGRMDIFVTAPVLNAGLGPCVLEVKVLRSRRIKKLAEAEMKDGHADWWAMKGVNQAHLYRTDMAAPTAYLLCFDARDENSDLPEVRTYAATKNVRFQKYFMYRSSEDLHAALLPPRRKRSPGKVKKGLT